MKVHFILISLLAITLSGCKKEPYIVKSTLEVDQALEVKDDNSKMIRFNTGSYPTDLNINSSRVKATVKTAANKSVTFRIKLPKNIKIPDNGTLELTPAQSGQAFLTSVTVKTEITDGPSRREFEDCFTSRHECWVVGNPPVTQCGTRDNFGRRSVEYFVRSYARNFEALLTPAQATTASANIVGDRTDRERIYTYQGICF
jgi:hypothetical protein